MREAGRSDVEVAGIGHVGGEWLAGDAVVWMRGHRDLYCWSCSSRTCEHVHAVWDYLRNQAKPSGDAGPLVEKEER